MQFKAMILSVVAWLSSGANWATLRPMITELLKQAWVRTILLQIFGGMISGGYQAWIAKLIVEYAFESLALPIINLGFRKMGYVYYKVQGDIIFKRIEQAKEDNNATKYDAAVDSMFRN